VFTTSRPSHIQRLTSSTTILKHLPNQSDVYDASSNVGVQRSKSDAHSSGVLGYPVQLLLAPLWSAPTMKLLPHSEG